ncbi:MAG: putative quinol monooxygenase [Paracoccaceae bacterium]
MGVTLSGYLDVPDADIAIVEKHLSIHILLSRAEYGCISFDVRPDPNNSNRYLVDEEFTTQAAFDAHQTRTKASEWGTATAHLHRKFSIK